MPRRSVRQFSTGRTCTSNRPLTSEYDEQATADDTIHHDEHFANGGGTPTGTSVAHGRLNEAILRQKVPGPGTKPSRCN
jgi:hypothetical protein